MRCDFRTNSECSCPAGQCAAQPKPLPPHHSFDARFHLSAFVVIGAIATFLSIVALPYADKHFKDQALEQQESIKHG